MSKQPIQFPSWQIRAGRDMDSVLRYAYCRNLLRLLLEMELLTAAEHDRILLSCAARFVVRAYV